MGKGIQDTYATLDASQKLKGLQMPKPKILLVDYDPRSIKQCKEVLIKNFDCQVEVALDGIAALNLFPQTKADLVIVEAMLPKKHGFEVCHEIKKSAQGKNTPVIIVTHVYKGRKYRHQAFHIYSCDEYLEKPISDQFLIETVKKFLPSAKEAAPPTEKQEISVESKQDVEEERARSEREEKAVSTEEKASEVKEKVAIHDEKATVVAKELEQEISSKVDEILTLFSENLAHSPSKESEPAQDQEAVEAEVETEVKEKPKKKTKAKKSRKGKKKKPEPALVAVAKEEVLGQASESSSFLSEEKSKTEVEEEEIKADIPASDEEIAEEEAKTQEQEEAKIQEDIMEDAEAQQEEAQTPEQKIEEAIETKLGAIEKLEDPQEEEPKEDLQEVKEEETRYEEPIKEEQIKKEEALEEETETIDEHEEEVEVKEPSEEVSKEIPEEVLASAPPRKSFFKSRTFFIGFSAIIVLGIIFLLFPLFKGKKEDSTPVQAGASVSSSLIEKEKITDTDLKSSALDSDESSLEQEQEKLVALEESGTTESSKPISTSKQSRSASQTIPPTAKSKAKQTIKQESKKKTTPPKTSPITDKKQENTRKPAPSPKKISETPMKKPAPKKTVTSPPPKAVPSSTKQDSTDVAEKTAPKKDLASSPKPAAEQKAAEAMEEQKITQPQETPQEVSQDSQKQASQPEESPLPEIGQLLDYSLLDRDPPYLAHDPPKYPVLARLKGIEGQVVLKVLIKETGYVEEVKLAKGLDESIDEAAIKAAYQWVYRPPTSQGIRVKTWKMETLTFPPK